MRVTRRTLLSGAAAAWASVGVLRSVRAAPSAKIHETKVISHQPHLYHGWPTVARRRTGQLLLVYSGGREAHVCPFGRVELMRSDDEGRSWSWPRVLMDSPIDDRDSGVLETAKGSILVTTFTSLAYESILRRAEQAAVKAQKPTTDAQNRPAAKRSGLWEPKKLMRWRAAHNRVPAEQRQAELGAWMIRSTDGGLTWSARYDCPVDSPHGPVQLSDGRLLYAGKDLRPGEHRVGVCQSSDDGQSWQWLADIPVRPDDSHRHYHELHAVETAGGRIVAQLRNHNRKNAGETLQMESSDGGKSWSVPHSIGVWGLPSHLLRLRDDRLLMTYGHRRPPLGNQARVSSDEGRTWSAPIIISGDGTSGDLGYPSTVQLADGSLLTVWYELMSGSPRAVLRQAHWSLAD